MTKQRRMQQRVLIAASICTILLLLGVLLLFYSTRETTDRFSTGLRRTDELIFSGNTRQALRTLERLRSEAITVTDYLSLAKRERQLNADAQLTETLRRGLAVFPVNQELAAFLAIVLQDTGQASEALIFNDYLSTGRWVAVAAATAFLTADSPLKIDPLLYLHSGEKTGFPFLLRNGIILYAMSGNINQALLAYQEYLSYFQNRDLMGVMLAYDAGQYRLSLDYAARNDASDPENLLLSADASYLLKDLNGARGFWETAVSRFPLFSARPYYNLAVTGENYTQSRLVLENVLGLFPTYYPAVAYYLALADTASRQGMTNAPPSVLEQELLRSGFRTLEMIDREKDYPVTLDKARAVLDRALGFVSAAGQDDEDGVLDSRFAIENLRFDERQEIDRLRSAGNIWKLLEQYSDDPLVHVYALWFFASNGSWDICFSLANSCSEKFTDGQMDGILSFYLGMQMATVGDLTSALEAFGKVANDKRNAWRAQANIARIIQKQGDLPSAIESFSLAAELAPLIKDRAALYYESGRLLAASGQYERARSLLGYAVELDSENYQAAVLLRELSFR